MVTRHDEQLEIVAPSEEDVDPKMVLMGELIVGKEDITWEEGKGPGAIPARRLPSPKDISTAQRRIHDLTHLPYDPGCGICVSCRLPNNHQRGVKDSEGTIPLVVEDYGFPKTSEEDTPTTLLIMRRYPYKILMCCKVPGKGRDPRVVARIVR